MPRLLLEVLTARPSGAATTSTRIEPNETAWIESAPKPHAGRSPFRAAPSHRAEVRRHGCRYERGRVRVAGCDYYYYDDEGEYYDEEGQSMAGWSPDQPMPNQDQSPGAAKLAPDPETYDQGFSPEGSDALREKLIAGRKNWMQKKATLDDTN